MDGETKGYTDHGTVVGCAAIGEVGSADGLAIEVLGVATTAGCAAIGVALVLACLNKGGAVGDGLTDVEDTQPQIDAISNAITITLISV